MMVLLEVDNQSDAGNQHQPEEERGLEGNIAWAMEEEEEE